MPTFRVNKTKNYTVMSNHHFKERKMSLKAKGLLSMMLSLPDDWDYSIGGLVSLCKENETAVKTALDELKKFGYLSVTKLYPNQTDSGRYEYIYNIYEEPHFQEVEKQPLENLPLEFPTVENLPVENMGLYKSTDKSNTDESNTNKSNTDDIVDKVVDYYREHCKGLIACQAVTNKRKTLIKSAYKVWGERIYEIMDKASKSDFLCGKVESKRGKPFKANMDFIFRSDVTVKIMEGFYSSSTSHKTAYDEYNSQRSDYDDGFDF